MPNILGVRLVFEDDYQRLLWRLKMLEELVRHLEAANESLRLGEKCGPP